MSLLNMIVKQNKEASQSTLEGVPMFKKEHQGNLSIMQHTADLLESAHDHINHAMKRLEPNTCKPLKMATEEVKRCIKAIDEHCATLES